MQMISLDYLKIKLLSPALIMKDFGQLTFSLDEYRRRFSAALQCLEKAQLDTVIINSPDTITYLTGYQTSGYDSFTVLVLSVSAEPFMFTRKLENINVLRRTWLEKSFYYEDNERAREVFVQVFKKELAKARRIGLEKDSFFLKHSDIQFLEQSVGAENVSDCTGIFHSIRAVKSAEEIDVMKVAAKSTEAGIYAGIEATRPGVTENEIAADVHSAMFKVGGEYPSVPPYITSGPRSIISHSTWEGREVKEGDNVFIEVGGCFRRYHTAMMRTVFVGRDVPKPIVESAKMISEELDTLMAAMKPGVLTGEIDGLTRDEARLQSIGATRVSRTGYGMGISYAPSWDEGHIVSLVKGSKTPLEQNMVFHLIPWVQLPELDTVVGISETVRVTESGAVSFFNIPRELVVKH